jgi:O-antigen/teichoic acid export membrane protein
MSRNFTSVAVAQFLSQVLALVVSVTLARILGVDFYGIFVFGFAFPNWFLLLLDLGINSVITIHVAADHEKAAEYLTHVTVLRIPLFIMTLAALWVALQFAIPDPFVREVTLILGASSAFGQFAGTFSTIFRAFERLEYVALVTILTQVLTTAAVLLLLFLGFDLIPIAVVYLLVSVVVTIITMWFCYRNFAWFARGVRRPLLIQIVREALPFGVSSVTATLLYTAGPVLLTLLADPIQTGIFNAAFALTNALAFPLSLYYLTVLPTMSRFYSHAPDMLELTLRKSHKLFFILGLPVAFGGLFYRESILTLIYGFQFASSGASFGILVLTLAIETATLGVGTALAASGRQPINLTIGILEVALILGLSILLIPALGPVGAAIAFAAGNLFGGTAGMIMVHRLIAKVDIIGTISHPLVAGGAMLLVLFVLGNVHLFIGIPVGAAVYFAVLFLIKGVRRDDWDLIKQIVRGALFR